MIMLLMGWEISTAKKDNTKKLLSGIKNLSLQTLNTQPLTMVSATRIL